MKIIQLQQPVNFASTSTSLSGTYDFFFSQEKGIASLILIVHTYTITLAAPCSSPSTTLKIFMFQSTITLAASYAGPSTTSEVFLFQSTIKLAVPRATPPFNYIGNFPMPVLLPFHLLILTPEESYTGTTPVLLT